jgi:hypothetical protein
MARLPLVLMPAALSRPTSAGGASRGSIDDALMITERLPLGRGTILLGGLLRAAAWAPVVVSALNTSAHGRQVHAYSSAVAAASGTRSV